MTKRVNATAMAIAVLFGVLAGEVRGAGGFGYPPQMPGAKVEVYKTVGDVKLNMYIYEPARHKATDKAAAIVFFFGGGWKGGSPSQFMSQCQYLASRGMVAMSADYRVSSRQGVKALACVQDAKSAIRWVRANAARLGIDPERIAAGGGSAGGHLAACTGTIGEFDEPGENGAISSVPNAMVLFNPAVVLALDGIEAPRDDARAEGLPERMGVEPIKLSPYHHVKKGAPTTIIFHGTADTTVPFKTVRLFTEAMTKAGNQCKLVASEGSGHGFFNARNKSNYIATVRAMDEFLVAHGFLKGKPTIGAAEKEK